MTIITTKSGTMINVEAAIKYDVDSELSEAITTHIEQLKSQSSWIKCSDRLPDRVGIYIVAEAGITQVDFYQPVDCDDEDYDGWRNTFATHWQELPPAPTGEG